MVPLPVRLTVLGVSLLLAALPARALQVFGNGLIITNKDFSPWAADLTDFETQSILGPDHSHTFTIYNDSTNTTIIVDTSMFELPPPGEMELFTFTDPWTPSLGPLESTTFTVTFAPYMPVTRDATVTVTSETVPGGQGASITFKVRGTGGLPEAKVVGNGKTILNGISVPALSNHTDFGAVNVGNSLTRTYTLSTTTACEMVLLPVGAVNFVSIGGPDASAFLVTQQPTNVVYPGTTTTFQVRFTPNDDRPLQAQASFDFNGDNNPFTFAIGGTGAAPDIAVSGKGVLIPDGSSVQSIANGTDFGHIPLWGGKATNDFVITNSGILSLNLTGAPPVQVTGWRAADFTVSLQPSNSVAPGSQTVFRIIFDPGVAGPGWATVTIGNNDFDEDPYTFDVAGQGALPEIDVAGNNVSIFLGDTTPATNDNTEFGPVRLATSHTHSFGVWNHGDMDLVLTGSPSVQITGPAAADFVAGSIPTSIAPNSVKGFTVQFTPSTTGVRQATISILNSDIDETPYTFLIEGTGIAPDITVLGNASVIADGDYSPGAADHTDFGAVATYRGSLTRTFTIRNDGTDTLTLSGPPYVTLSGLGSFDVTQIPAKTITAGSSTTFQVTFAPTATGIQSNNVRIISNDPDEASYDFAIRGTGVTPTMSVSGKGQWIPTGSQDPSTGDDTDFGGYICGSNHSHIYTITNSGTFDLALTGTPRVVFSGPAAGDFALTASPAASVPTNAATTSFTVRFRPTAGGWRTATVGIPSGDPDRDPYTFQVRGFGLQTLTNDVPVSLAPSPATNGFYYQSLTSGWSVVAVTPRSTNFNLNVATNTGFNPLIGMSQEPGTNVDYVLLNGHLQPASGARYAQVYGGGTGSYLVESEWIIPDLQDGDFLEQLHLGTNETVDLFEANLNALQLYDIVLSRAQTNVTLTCYVFDPENGTAVPGDYDTFATASGTNSLTHLHYTPTFSGWHAILVVNTSRRECDYALGLLTGPEMRLLGNNVAVTNGDVTPAAADYTDLGTADVGVPEPARQFQIQNPGVSDLRLSNTPPVKITGPFAAEFAIAPQPATTITPDGSKLMGIAFTPSHCGLSSATVVITNNDPGANPFTFVIQGRGFHRLGDNSPLSFTNAPEDLAFRTTPMGWVGLGVKVSPENRTVIGTAVADWSSTCVTSAAAGSVAEAIVVAATFGGATDHYARVTGGTTSNFTAEYRDSAQSLTLGNPELFSQEANDTLELFDVELNAGEEYYVAADPAIGGETGDMTVLVLRPDRRWGSRSDCDWAAQAQGVGARESVAFTAPVAGRYAIAVLQETRVSGNWWVLAARAVPDMVVQGNGVSIANDSSSPALGNHTRFNDTSTLGSSTRTYTIRNNGYKDLQLNNNPRVQITGTHAGDFTVTQQPAASVALRGGSTSFTVTFRPRGRGLRQAQVVIPNSQSDRNPFTFAISGNAIGPLMRVEGLGYDVPDGSLSPSTTNGTDFWSKTAGLHSQERTFDILNPGEDMLSLTGSPAVTISGPQAADFTADLTSLAPSMSAGGQTWFRIIFKPSQVGVRQATVRIRCDDPERDPFEFAIRGEGVLPRLTRLRHLGNSVELSWKSLDDAHYTILSGSQPQNGITNLVQGNIPGTAEETTLSIAAPTNRSLFYRILVQP
jgi:hypothetical protein